MNFERPENLLEGLDNPKLVKRFGYLDGESSLEVAISVIIPFRNRFDHLVLTLKSLAKQTFTSYEVVVVDDGSYGVYDLELERLDLPFSLTYIYCSRPNFNVDYAIRRSGQVRNVGVRYASGARLVFLDSDMVVDSSFLKLHGAHDSEVVLGYRSLQTFDGQIKNDEREKYFLYFNDDISQMNFPWYLLYSHNFSVSKQRFVESGGFDEGFFLWGIEDQELGYRLYKAGVKFIFLRSASAIHQYHEVDKGDEGLRDSMQKYNVKYFYRKFEDEVIKKIFSSFNKKSKILSLDSKCNNNCIVCSDEPKVKYSKHVKYDLDFDYIISGTEPTLSKDYFEVLRNCSSNGISFKVLTNGRSFSIINFARKSMELGATKYLFKVFGYDNKSYAKWTNTSSGFSQQIRGLRNLKELGVLVGAYVLIGDHNFLDFDIIIKFVKDQGFDGINIKTIFNDFEKNLSFLQRNNFDGVLLIDPIMKCVRGRINFKSPEQIKRCVSCKFWRKCNLSNL